MTFLRSIHGLILLMVLAVIGCRPSSQDPTEVPAPNGSKKGIKVGTSSFDDGLVFGDSSKDKDKDKDDEKDSKDEDDGKKDPSIPVATPTPTSTPDPGVCEPGYYCPPGTLPPQGAGQCDPGYYCPTGSTVSTGSGPCDAGYYCPMGSSKRNEFPSGAGYYTMGGADKPQDCGIGFFCPQEANTAPIACNNKPANSEYVQANVESANCPFECVEGYQKNEDGTLCLEIVQEPDAPPPDPIQLTCTARAAPLQQGSCQVGCPSGMNISFLAVQSINNGSQCTYSYGGNFQNRTTASCRGFNSATIGQTQSNICRCTFSCQ